MTRFKLYINNDLIDGSNGVKVKSGSLNLQFGQPGERSILNFALIDLNPLGAKKLLTYDIGQLVELYDENDNLKFAGQFDDPDLSLFNEKPIFYQSLSCVDWVYITDRIYVNKSYPKMLISDIFKDIIDNFLASDGLTYDANSIQETTNQYASINCSYANASDVFRELASLINWEWKIGTNKKVYLFPVNTNIGTQLIEHTTNYVPNSLRYKRNRNDYRNVQILLGVNGITDLLTEVVKSNDDTDNSSFLTRFPINEKPKIYIVPPYSNYVNNPSTEYQVDPRQVGINGIDTGLQWYWSKSTNSIVYDKELTTIPQYYQVIVQYKGQYKIDVVQQNITEINARKAIEGGSGKYINLESADNIEDVTVAANKANAMLNKYIKIAQSIVVESYTVEWEIGEIIDMIIPSMNINSLVSEGNGFLCISKQINDQGGILKKSYEFINGNAIGGWVRYFSKWLQGGKNWVLREDALVEIPILAPDNTEWHGSTKIDRITCLYPNTNLYPSNALYPGIIANTQTEVD